MGLAEAPTRPLSNDSTMQMQKGCFRYAVFHAIEGKVEMTIWL